MKNIFSRSFLLIFLSITFSLTTLHSLEAGPFSLFTKLWVTTTKGAVKGTSKDIKVILDSAKETGTELMPVTTHATSRLMVTVQRVKREALHKEECEKAGREFVKVKIDNSPIYEHPDPQSKILGKYELKEKICVRYEKKGFGLTSFGWIEINTYE